MAGARRGAEEGRYGPSSDRDGYAIASLDRRIRTASRRTSGRRARQNRTTPTSASSISIRRGDEPDVLRAAALALRDLLEELGLQSWVKTSGSKGFHIVAPLDASARFDEVARFAHGVGAVLVARASGSLTQEFSKADRRAASTSTPDATATARRSRRPTPCARSQAHPCRRRARGRSRARGRRPARRLRCGRWGGASKRRRRVVGHAASRSDL